jgi:hypothetical protein
VCTFSLLGEVSRRGICAGRVWRNVEILWKWSGNWEFGNRRDMRPPRLRIRGKTPTFCYAKDGAPGRGKGEEQRRRFRNSEPTEIPPVPSIKIGRHRMNQGAPQTRPGCKLRTARNSRGRGCVRSAGEARSHPLQLKSRSLVGQSAASLGMTTVNAVAVSRGCRRTSGEPGREIW